MSNVTPPGQPATILIVDDEAGTHALFRMMLRPYANWRVLGAETGQRAAEIAEAELPDVILLDVMMPDVNGIEVCARLRQLPHLRASKIVMLTVLHTQSSRDAAVVAGADEFWTKPISPQALRSGIARLLGDGAPAANVSHQLNSRSRVG